MNQEIVTTKIERESLRRLKVIAALTGERMTDVLKRLIDVEYKRIQKQQQEKR